MGKAYVVMGEIGQYSDHTVWPVRVFADRASAEQFALSATNHLMDLSGDTEFRERLDNMRGPYDGHEADMKLLTMFDQTLARRMDNGVIVPWRWRDGDETVEYGVIEIEAED